MNTSYDDMTHVLPGWIRFRNVQTGTTIDINPRDPVHQRLLDFFQKSAIWQQIAP